MHIFLLLMPGSLNHTQTPWIETYSEIIDVRSPSEFAEDHIPGAINLPVLDDDERATVGTIYKQDSPFKARKLGAALVSKNISQYLLNHFANKEKDYSPLVYCWRGGQRSHSMATVLTEVGWRVTVVQGGYKTYRTYVCQQLQQLPEKFTFRVLGGMTGTGKTYILRQMAQRGFQVLDLEGLANHRGSLLGEEWQESRGAERAEGVGEWGSRGVGEKVILYPDNNSHQSTVNNSKLNFPSSQPLQKYFESLLLQQLQSFNPNEIVWVEAESNKIGRIYLPQSLWQIMKQASCVEINLALGARIQYLLQTYPHLTTHPEFLKDKLSRLKSKHGRDRINYWYELIDTCDWTNLVIELLQFHYDPSYTKSLGNCYSQVEQRFLLNDLSDTSINMLIEQLGDKYS